MDEQALRRETLALIHQSHGVDELFGRLQSVVDRRVGFDGCCWMTFDPATVLPTGHIPYRSIPPEQVARLAENEYFEEDVNKFCDLVRGAHRAGTIRLATDGEPSRSTRFQVLLDPNGFRDELRVSFERDGSCWGGLALYRRRADEFTAADAAALASVSGLVADGIRRAILTSAVGADDTPDAPGLVLLGAGNAVDAVSSVAAAWLDDLVLDSEGPGAELPNVVYAIASQARRAAGGDDTAGAAVARARGRSGRWVVLHGSVLDGTPDGRVAVIVEPARPPQIAPLVAMAYGLSARERDVTRLVIQGMSTAEIADALSLSAHTVQDYLKSVFDKVGVRSRREMVARVFTDHYSPRLERGEPVGASGWFAR